MCIFLNWLNHDSGKKIPNIFRAYVSVKKTLVCRFMMLLSQKEAFCTIKMSFYCSRKG